jgi:hypothetical protein
MKRSTQLAILFALLVCCFPAAGWAQVLSLDLRITGSSDDAEEDGLGVVTPGDATLDLGGVGRRVGMRFPNITIPRYAAITKAYIEFTADGTDSTGTTFTIEGDYAENAATFTTAAGSISVRDVYAASVSWAIYYAWQTIDQLHQSAELKSLVQLMVNRSGWNSGNAMAFIVSSAANESIVRRAKSANASGTKGPKLHIEYTANILDVRVSADTDDMNQYWSTSQPGTIQNLNYLNIGRSTSTNTNYADCVS